MLCLPHLAHAQAHEARRGELVLRSSTVASDRIDPATAAKHGIEPASDRGVLNVVLLRRGDTGERTLPASVSVSMQNLAGVRQDVPMWEVRENGWVSYIGSYSFLPREVVDFEVRASPAGGGPTLSVKFRERMWKR